MRGTGTNAARVGLVMTMLLASCRSGELPSRTPRAEGSGARIGPVIPARLYFNGKVYTAASQLRHAEAIAVRSGKILRIGKSEDLRRELPDFELVDLRGRTVVPGFNDAHLHHIPDPAGIVVRFPPEDEPTTAKVRDAIAAAARKAPGSWIIVEVGIAVMEDTAFDREYLDRIASANPVFVRAFYGHGHVLNSRALRELSIQEDIADPPGGRFGRTKAGRLDGHAFEYAEWITGRRLAALASDSDIAASQAHMFEEALHFGVTSVQNMSWTPAERYLRLAASNRRAPRLRWINWQSNVAEGVLPRRASVDGSTVSVSGIKWILDGTPLERGAAISFPYNDSTTASRPNFSQDEVNHFVDLARAEHQQILLHAVGDVAIREALVAAERIPPAERAALRPRIEHGDWVSSEQDAALKALSMVVVQNPSHLVSVPMLERRFGPERRAMRLASLARGGVHVALGSDGPLNPYLNMMFAITHPYRPSEALTREEAVDAYTRESAYAELAELEKGTLEQGKSADFAVLSQDIFSCPVPALPATFSVLTVVEGEVLSGAASQL